MLHDLNQNRDHYDRVLKAKPSLYYERFDRNILKNRPFVAALVAEAFRRYFPSPVDQLLDLGCGTGFYYPLLARHARSITGVDVSREMLREAQQVIAADNLSGCRVIEASALALPMTDKSMDAVHAWDFLHHLSDVDQAITEIARVLKPGGCFVALEPNLVNPSIAWYHARRRSEWRLFLQNQFTLPSRLRRDFDVQINFDNTIISFLDDRTEWIWKAADKLTSYPLLDRLSFRYVLRCKRR
ncbi:MAG: class I SAM-dependent methyltransferase [Planctomycetota bacterium]